MTGYVGKTTNSGEDIVSQYAQQEREAMWGPIPGRVVSYDAAKGTATVQPLYKPVHNGEAVDMPELYEVPVDQPRTGNAGITLPVSVGTRVLLTPMMRSMENYDDTDDGTPSDARSFSLSDMRATITGGDSLSDPLPNADPDNVHLRFSADGGFGIKGSPDGKIAINGAGGNIYTLIADFMDLVAGDELQIAYGSSAGSGHALQNRGALMAIAAQIRAMAL